MTAFMWKMAGALVAGLIGLAMLFWALEKTSLIAFADSGQEGAGTPFSVYIMLFAGLVLINLSLFFAVLQWSRFLGENPDTKQLPVWAAILLSVFAGGALLYAFATHAAWMRAQDPVPMTVNDGLILFQVMMGALFLIPLVLIGVRWAPGYKRPSSD